MGENALSQDVAKTQPRPGDPLELTICGVKAVFRYCPPGTFLMGSPESEKGRLSREIQREVTLARGFWLLETPITQALWTAVVGINPSFFRGSDARPAERVSWFDCEAFIDQVNSGGFAPDGMAFGFPTEEEWERACRAGTSTAYNVGEVLTERDANFGSRVKETTPVKSYAPNPWNLYDMHGNVFEWRADQIGDYPPHPATDPFGLQDGAFRVARGGAWNAEWAYCRSASRAWNSPEEEHRDVGFRPCLRTNV